MLCDWGCWRFLLGVQRRRSSRVAIIASGQSQVLVVRHIMTILWLGIMPAAFDSNLFGFTSVRFLESW